MHAKRLGPYSHGIHQSPADSPTTASRIDVNLNDIDARPIAINRRRRPLLGRHEATDLAIDFRNVQSTRQSFQPGVEVVVPPIASVLGWGESGIDLAVQAEHLVPHPSHRLLVRSPRTTNDDIASLHRSVKRPHAPLLAALDIPSSRAAPHC